MKWFFIIVWGLCPILALGNEQATAVNSGKDILIKGQSIGVFRDHSNKMSFEGVRNLNESFYRGYSSVPNAGITNSTIWVRIKIRNETRSRTLLVKMKNPLLEEISFYYPTDADQDYVRVEGGNLIPVSNHFMNTQANVFKLPIDPGTTKTVYFRVKSSGQLILPVYVGTYSAIIKGLGNEVLIFGIYLGVIFIMFFYNLFIYFSVRDKSYLYYIGYILAVGFTQFVLGGYGYSYFWNRHPYITLQSVNWVGALSGIASALFLRVFLQTPKRLPVFDKFLQGIIILYACTIPLTLFGAYNTGFILIDILAFIGCIAFWWAGFKLMRQGYRPAYFFLIAWSFFIASIVIQVLKDFGVVPYNGFTDKILLIGSTIEIALLSFALADQINFYKREREKAQRAALKAAREKEEYIRKENIILEKTVKERTSQLVQSNDKLNEALLNLRSAQSQLVHAEKMSSLGQLTAGVAHEINNPINFIKSNIRPLELDVNDLLELVDKSRQVGGDNWVEKQKEMNAFIRQIDLDLVKDELKMLLSGIKEGADRTAEIVKGLRTFSRVDESGIKSVDIHQGIDSTLGLINHIIDPDMVIEKEYDPNLPLVECNPGKINQVFMNLLTNAVQAMQEAPAGTLKEKRLKISTNCIQDTVVIQIADTGPGIPEEMKVKIFDPFFTTKEVGKGSGLGLSITYNIIQEHKGQIEVVSEVGVGTRFVIVLPLRQPPPAPQR